MSRVTTLIPKRIASIRFGLMDPSEIRKCLLLRSKLLTPTKMMVTHTGKV